MLLQADVQLGVSAGGGGTAVVVSGGIKLVVGKGMLRVLVKKVVGSSDVTVEASEVAGKLVVGMMTLVCVKGGGTIGVETLTEKVEVGETMMVVGIEVSSVEVTAMVESVVGARDVTVAEGFTTPPCWYTLRELMVQYAF